MSSDEFLAKVGDTSHLPEPEGRDEGGRFTSARSSAGRKLALAIVEDAQCLENLLIRARDGALPPGVEVHIWKMAYGEPPKDDAEAEEARKRYAEVRRLIAELVKVAPNQAHALEAKVVGAKRVLPMPRLKAPPDDGSDPSL